MHVVVAGNVVEDRAPDGRWTAGGPSLFSARMALALGARVTLVTRLAPSYDRTVLAGLDVVAIAAERTPRYVNSYRGGDRTQLLLDVGEPLDAELPACDVLLLAPAFHEFARVPISRARVTGVALQGVLRARDADGVVVPHPQPWDQAAPFVSAGSFSFFSDEDTADAGELGRRIAAAGATALVTRGHRGLVRYDASGAHESAAIPSPREVDPTGAGDCFATSFLVRFAEAGDITEATQFALAAGSLAVEGEGLAGIPGRAAIEERMQRVAV